MNLLARILSHGFALAVVALIAIALMYRGDLFPEWDLPEFLVVDGGKDSGQAQAPAATDSTLPDTAASSPETSPATTSGAGEAVDAGESAAVIEPAAPAPETAAESPIPAVADSTESAALVEQQSDDATGEVREVLSPESADTDEQAAPDAHPADEASSTEDLSGASAVTPESVLPLETGTEGAGESAEPVLVEQEASTPAMQPPVQEEVGQPALPAADSEAGAEVETAGPGVTEEPATAPEAEVAEATETIDSTAPAVPESEVVDEPVAAPVASEPAATEEPATPEQVPAPTSVLPAEETASAPEQTAYELLAAAREAYWLRDYEKAEEYYRQLIQLEPDNPDGYGELGNMYFAQGQWEDAAASYYEAGVRMVNQGMVVQASQLVDVIRGLNGDQADELELQVKNASR